MAIALAPALVIAGLLVFVVYQGNLQHNRRLLDQQGQLLAAQLAAALEYGLATGALEQLPALVDAAVQPATAILGTPVRSVVVTDRDGRPLYRLPAADPAPAAPLADPTVVPAEEDRVRFAAPVLLRPLVLSPAAPAPRPLGEVAVELSVAVAQAQWQRRLAWDLGLVLLAFAGAAGLAHWTGQRLSGAIRRIAGAIERIKNGDLAARLPQTDLNELGTLQEGVNLLADAIERGKAHLEAELALVRDEYRDALQALEQANQAKSLFLAKISHEMRTPLYSVLGLLEQVLKTGRDPAEARTLRTIQDAAETLNRHIGDILDVTQLAQLEKEGQRLPCDEPVKPWAELEAVAALQEPLMIARALYLDVIVAPNVPAVVKSNVKAIQEIFSNLLGNAVKYTQTGGIVVWLETAMRPTSDPSVAPTALRLRVADTGCGIPEDRLESIFREFEQVDEAYNRRHGGAGLGLSFVKKNCALLGGHVTVASTPERGSTFTVEWPFLPVDDPPSEWSSGAMDLPSGGRVLVADERASFRASVISRFAGLNILAEEQAMPPTALASSRPPGPRYDLLVVQNVAALAEATLPEIIAGLHRWAETLIALETDYDTSAVRRLRQAGVDLILWSGATCAHLREALARHARQAQADEGEEIAGLDTSPAPLAGRTVLVVEDYDINRAIMANQLKGNGARVLEAADGETAVALAAEPGLDLILMDIQMPGMDGFEAIEAIRRMSCGARLPILGFTASADRPTRQRILRVGADGVLTKPIGEAELVQAIRRALRQVKTGHRR